MERIDRINELLQQEISLLLQQDAEKLGMISVLSVQTSRDLHEARVYIAPVKTMITKELMATLMSRTHSYKTSLLKKLDLKRIPDLLFIVDTHGNEVNRVEALLDTIERGDA